MQTGVLHHSRGVARAFLKDWLRYRRALQQAAPAYLRLCNRNERLAVAPDGSGFRCEWQWTSELDAPKFLPRLGSALMTRALHDHPIGRADAPAEVTDPQVSFVIGHRGLDRLPHLQATLASIAGQSGAKVECIVVEQDNEALIAGKLPAWVRYLHTPLRDRVMPFSRSWAFNEAVRHVRSKTVILHDNDMLVPQDYAATMLARMAQGFEVVNAKRFIFYLTEEHTRAIFEGSGSLTSAAPLAIVQNLEGGGSVGITLDAYQAIGGFDEDFLGWGGEDVEFWERAGTRRLWPYASMPIVHLWHSAQPEKHMPDSPNLRLYHERARIAPGRRVQRLVGLK
jgi:hypothetical protein